MRLPLSFYVVCAALLSFSAALGTGCSVPTPETPPFQTSSAKKAKKGSTTTDDEEEEEGLTTPQGGAKRRPTPSPPPLGTIDAGQPTPAVDAGTGPGPATGECAPNTTAEACFSCCETAHPQGTAFLRQAFGDCACGGGTGNCVAQCGDSFCVGLQPTAACIQCLDASTACQNQADTACVGNTNCAALFNCDRTSQCASKP